MRYERILNQEKRPTETEISRWVGRRIILWSELRDYLASNYDFTPELDFAGRKYGWAMRYRKGGKTLVTLFPERGGFTVLIVLGKKEVIKAEAVSNMLSAAVRKLFEQTDQSLDGRCRNDKTPVRMQHEGTLRIFRTGGGAR